MNARGMACASARPWPHFLMLDAQEARKPAGRGRADGGARGHDVRDWPQGSFSGRCRAARVCCANGAAGHLGPHLTKQEFGDYRIELVSATGLILLPLFLPFISSRALLPGTRRFVGSRQTPMPQYYSQRATGRNAALHWERRLHCVNEPNGLKSTQAASKVWSASIVLCVIPLMRADEPEKTAFAIKLLIEDECLRLSMIKSARKVVLEHYTWNKVAGDFDALLCSL
jgi:hypothetical protein